MIATRTGLRLPALVGLIAVLATLGLWSPWPADTPAGASGAVSVGLTSAALVGAGADEAVVLSGTVTNASAQAVAEPTVYLWRSSTVLRSRQTLAAALAAEAPPAGRWEPVAPGNSRELGGPLAPGESRVFTVSGLLSDLLLTARDASYWVGVDVRGRADADADVARLALARTLVTLPGPDAHARVATVVELSAPPRQLKPGLFADDGLADDLAGRLGTLVEAAARPGTAWVVDPSLLEEVRDAADGYRVVAADGGTTPGSGQDAAAAWLEAFEALPTASGSVGVFAMPDVTSALDVGGADVVDAAFRAGASVEVPDVPGVVVLDAPDAAALAAALDRARPVLATGTDAPAAWVQAGETRVVAARRPEAARAVALEDTPLNRAAILTALARVEGDQVRLVRSGADVAADALAAPAWLVRHPLADLVAGDPAAWVPGADGAPSPVLDAAALEGVRSLAAALEAYAAAAPASGVDATADAQVARAASGWWAGRDADRDAWLAALDARVGWTALHEGIVLSTSPRFSMAGAESDFPVTVTNRLDDEVLVTVVARTDNPQRIRFEQPDPATIAPGASETITLRAVAAGSGVVNALVHVEAPGDLRLTPDAAIVVETSNVGVIGWVLVLASGVALVVTTALRIRQVRARTAGDTDG